MVQIVIFFFILRALGHSKNGEPLDFFEVSVSFALSPVASLKPLDLREALEMKSSQQLQLFHN